MNLAGRCAALACASFMNAALAVQPPDAGQVLEGIRPRPKMPSESGAAVPELSPARPAMPLPADVKVRVKQFRISGAKAFSSDELAALLQDATNREWSLAALQSLADRITTYYQKRGYVLARAYIPAQSIEDGTVEIAILEGRLGRLHLDNQSLLVDSAVERQVSDLREGEAIEGKRLERILLLLNDLPGVDVKSTLKPGASVGLTDLDVVLRTDRRVDGTVELDNHGNRFTGSVRLGGSVNINSPLGLGDALTLRGLTAGEGMDYGRIAYQVPVGSYGTKAGLAWSQMHYELQKDFASLNAHGEAEIATAYLLQPFVRSRRANLNGQLSFDHKRLDDRVDATSIISQKDVDVWSLGLSGDFMDGLGGGAVTQYSASVVTGKLHLDSTTAASDRASLHTQGYYSKLTYQLARAQALAGDFSLHARLSGQVTDKNLDSSEKFSLGGTYGVRAYPQGEAASDEAWLGTVEVRYSPVPTWQVLGFYDAAQGRLNHASLPAGTRNTRWLAGAGVGVAWLQANNFTLQAYAAWRTAAQPLSDHDRSPRLWLQGVKYF